MVVDHSKLCHWPFLLETEQTPFLQLLPLCHVLHYVNVLHCTEEPGTARGTPNAV